MDRIDQYLEEVVAQLDCDPLRRDEIRLEVHHHLRELVGDGVASGKSEEDAITDALHQFGAADAVAERLTAVHRGGPAPAVWEDRPHLVVILAALAYTLGWVPGALQANWGVRLIREFAFGSGQSSYSVWTGLSQTLENHPGGLVAVCQSLAIAVVAWRYAPRRPWLWACVGVVGVPALALVPMALQAWRYLGLGSDPPSPDDRPIDVLILADLDPTAPERYGYTLHTHVQLWRAACDLIKARIETFTEDQAEAVLTRAEQKMDLRVEEAVRKSMVGVLGAVAGNGILWDNLSQVLVDNKVRIEVRGSGWSCHPLADIAQPVGGLADRYRVLRMAKLVICADVTGEVDGRPLAAAGCGAVVVARSHPRDTRPGGLATLLKSGAEMVAFQYGRELLAAVRQLLGSADLRRRISGAAWERCRAEHAPLARLKGLEVAASSCFTRGPSQP